MLRTGGIGGGVKGRGDRIGNDPSFVSGTDPDPSSRKRVDPRPGHLLDPVDGRDPSSPSPPSLPRPRPTRRTSTWDRLGTSKGEKEQVIPLSTWGSIGTWDRVPSLSDPTILRILPKGRREHAQSRRTSGRAIALSKPAAEDTAASRRNKELLRGLRTRKLRVLLGRRRTTKDTRTATAGGTTRRMGAAKVREDRNRTGGVGGGRNRDR